MNQIIRYYQPKSNKKVKKVSVVMNDVKWFKNWFSKKERTSFKLEAHFER